jgi:hypothetical protein
MDISNPIIQLCIRGTQAEFFGQPQEAAAFYAQAWKDAATDYEFCIAAHYMARFQPSPEEMLRWNQRSLEHAQKSDPALVRDFLPSLYLNLGKSYELMCNPEESQKYYRMAANLGADHLDE